MNGSIKTLPEVFPGAFTGRCLELAQTIGVVSVSLSIEKRRMVLIIAPEEPLTEELRAHLLACLDMALKGQVQIELHIQAPVEEIHRRFQRLPEKEKTLTEISVPYQNS